MGARARRIALAVVALLAAWIIAAWALDLRGRGRSAMGQYDAIIVLGARVLEGGTATGSLRRRTERAVELWQAGVAPRIVFTGGFRGDRPSEASIAASIARGRGVPDSAVLMEELSTSTLENARGARELVGPVRVLVVTDTYHVLRAELVFRRQFPEADVIGVSNGALPQMREAIREVLALGAFVARDLAGS